MFKGFEDYSEFISCSECNYLIACEHYEDVCVKIILGEELVDQPGYTPEDILARFKEYKEREKRNKELESGKLV